MAAIVGCRCHFYCVGTNARGNLLLSNTCATLVGGDVVFCPSWGMCSYRGLAQEEVDQAMWPAAPGSFRSFSVDICGGNRFVAVLRPNIQKQIGGKGHNGGLLFFRFCKKHYDVTCCFSDRTSSVCFDH